MPHAPQAPLVLPHCLEGKVGASRGGDRGLGAARSEEAVAVRDAGEGSFGGRVGAAAESDVVRHGISGGVAVGEVDGIVTAALEDGALDEDLSP